MTPKPLIAAIALTFAISAPLHAAKDVKVKITPELASVEVMHDGKKTTIMRNQDA